MVCPTELQISVYKTEKDLNDNKQFCEIAYLLDEENGEYDIIHNPEKFILYVDGEKVVCFPGFMEEPLFFMKEVGYDFSCVCSRWRF